MIHLQNRMPLPKYPKLLLPLPSASAAATVARNEGVHGRLGVPSEFGVGSCKSLPKSTLEETYVAFLTYLHFAMQQKTKGSLAKLLNLQPNSLKKLIPLQGTDAD